MPEYTSVRRAGFAVVAFGVVFCCLSRGGGQTLPKEGGIAPGFSLHDTYSKVRKLESFRGCPTLLAFFCGCQSCEEFARCWGRMQRAGVLNENLREMRTPRTLVVFMGTPAGAQRFVETTTLDSTQTVILPDPGLLVAGRYSAAPCPRLFVLDALLHIRYVNSHKDDRPQEAPAATLVARTLDALRSCQNTLNPIRSANKGAKRHKAPGRHIHRLTGGRQPG